MPPLKYVLWKSLFSSSLKWDHEKYNAYSMANTSHTPKICTINNWEFSWAFDTGPCSDGAMFRRDRKQEEQGMTPGELKISTNFEPRTATGINN